MSSEQPAFLSLTGDATDDVAALGRWLEATDPVPLLIETSGSTGRPKRVVLSRDAIVASAEASAACLGRTGPWALALPSSYVAGVQVIVRSLLAGHAPVHVGDGGLAQAVAQGARFVSLVPTQLARLLDDPAEADALTALHCVLLGGGPIDPTMRHRAEDQAINVVATYGASETAGGCVYDGRPLDGVRVDVDEDGRIRIAGPTLFSGYDGDDELTRETLVDGWYLTADAGRIDDGRLTVLGRLDDVVVSGGLNVPTPAVSARLRQHPGVREVEVLGVPDDEWGARVVAFVAGSLTLEEARDWVAAEHPRAWAPRQVVALDRLPLLANGKVDRATLVTRARELA